jgi:hypothetical protein
LMKLLLIYCIIIIEIYKYIIIKLYECIRLKFNTVKHMEINIYLFILYFIWISYLCLCLFIHVLIQWLFYMEYILV